MDHKKIAITAFNKCWDYMDKKNRVPADDLEMIRLAHESLYHWKFVGTSLHEARGEWQISRVYSVLKLAEPAYYHGKKSLDLCLENDIKDFDLAFGYEAVANALCIMDNDEANAYLQKGYNAAKEIKDKGNREYTIGELDKIKNALS